MGRCNVAIAPVVKIYSNVLYALIPTIALSSQCRISQKIIPKTDIFVPPSSPNARILFFFALVTSYNAMLAKVINTPDYKTKTKHIQVTVLDSNQLKPP